MGLQLLEFQNLIVALRNGYSIFSVNMRKHSTVHSLYMVSGEAKPSQTQTFECGIINQPHLFRPIFIVVSGTLFCKC